MKLLLYRRYISVPILMLYSVCMSAQSGTRIDSLKASLRQQLSQEHQVTVLREITNAYASAQQMDSAIVYAKKCLPLIDTQQHKGKFGQANFFLGSTYLRRNDYVSAEPYLLTAEKYYDHLEDDTRRVNLDHALGALYFSKKKLDKAIGYYQRIIAMFNSGKKVDKAHAMNAYANVYSYYLMQQQYGNALNAINDYIDFTGKFYPDQLGQAYQTLAHLYELTSENRKSIAILQKSIELLEQQHNAYLIAGSRLMISKNYMTLRKHDSARKYLGNALQYYRSVDSSQQISMALNMLASMSFEEHDYEQAEKYMLDAIRLTHEKSSDLVYHNSFLWTIRLSKLMKDSTLKQGKNRAMLENVTNELTRNFNAIQSREGYISPDLYIHNYEVLSSANEELGNYELALSYLKKKTDLKDSIYGTEKLMELTTRDAELELARQKNRITLEEETKRLQLQKEIDLKALRYEYERKQALAKTAEEKKRLMLEEELKRKEIGLKYEQEQKAITLKYEQEKKIRSIEQEKKDAIAAAELSRIRNIRNMSAMGVGLVTLLLGITGWSYFQKRKDNRRIAAEKQKSDDLLLNILPHEVAEELKQKGETAARHHEEVSVLFTDFVNFTSSSEKIGVQEVLNELNICFTAFDNIMMKHGLEKIKTIGDAYLAVSGLPASNPQHAQQAIKAALDIISFIGERRKAHPNALEIRVGIHSGSVIAGIVGVKKFAYDIWGDTVNTAARMEQNGEKGKVNVSEVTYQLVKNDFACTHRGKIHTKGKGDMDMYFVEN